MRFLFYLLLLVIYSCTGGSLTEEVAGNRESEDSDIFIENVVLPDFCKDECKAEDFETKEYNGRGQSFLDGINAADAYAYLANQGKNWAGNDVKVAVVDSGVSFHSDLQDNILKDEAAKNSLSDRSGHGTHVAGIIAASKKIMLCMEWHLKLIL